MVMALALTPLAIGPHSSLSAFARTYSASSCYRSSSASHVFLQRSKNSRILRVSRVGRTPPGQTLVVRTSGNLGGGFGTRDTFPGMAGNFCVSKKNPSSKTPFEMLISGEEILHWFFLGKDVSYVQSESCETTRVCFFACNLYSILRIYMGEGSVMTTGSCLLLNVVHWVTAHGPVHVVTKTLEMQLQK